MGYGTSVVVSDMMSLMMPLVHEKPPWANVNIGYLHMCLTCACDMLNEAGMPLMETLGTSVDGV